MDGLIAQGNSPSRISLRGRGSALAAACAADGDTGSLLVIGDLEGSALGRRCTPIALAGRAGSGSAGNGLLKGFAEAGPRPQARQVGLFLCCRRRCTALSSV